MASLSVGDIVLCSQIAYRLLTAGTIGRKNAPRDLRELDNVLLALSCSLSHLENAVEVKSSGNCNPNPHAVDVQQNLGFMIRSCCTVLEDLERATAKYRDIIREPSSAQMGSNARFVKIKSQWRRFMWDFREESLTRYRQKLETHTAAINLILNTCIWSAADRIENNIRRQNQMMEMLLYQPSHLNGRFSALVHNVHLPDTSNHAESRLLSLLPALPEPTVR
ncbi:unnamed protein product [Penicillium salamii]|nr:unnamed protein product [Penicillium salamii]